ncbi:MAG TPA: hypothetical protein VK794_08805 [Steroidobacteraceae bacterium]|jgi:hypothetical protein|nr:hypothetical protein [Steroidobacteraceae bacterium]
MLINNSHRNLFRHLIRPTRGGAAVLVVVFAFLLFIASKAGLAGIPLAFIVISWFFKYAYVLFDHTVRGFDEPPTLDIHMVNPVSEQRPLGQVLILGLIGFGVYLAYQHWGFGAAMGLTLLVSFFLPASVAVLGLESNILKAAYPVAWFRLVLGLGWLYGAVLLVIFGYWLALDVLWKFDLWPPVEIALSLFAVLSVFSFLGGALYERRDELGIETWVSPERTAALLDKETQRLHDKVVLDAYGLMRANAHLKCWQVLTDWLQSRGHSPEDYRWLCERTETWDDSRYITRLTEERVARLLTLKRTGEALDVVAKRLKLDPAFRPKSAADTLNVAQLAARGGGASRVAKVLLSDFAARFAGDPRVAVAQALAQHLG